MRRGGTTQALTGVPIVYTYVLDMASDSYRETELFTGLIQAIAPFPVQIDFTKI